MENDQVGENFLKFKVANKGPFVSTDRQTDGQVENNRAPPNFVGGALINICIECLSSNNGAV